MWLEPLRKEVQTHAEKQYHLISDPMYSAEHQGSLFFVQHQLMITRFHVGLQLACTASNGAVELGTWLREPKLERASISVPKVRLDAHRKRWIEDTDSPEKVPHRPDAFFTLRFQGDGTPARLAHFFYEADRKTMTMSDMR